MSLPYFPLYVTDFQAKTAHLTLAEDGAYNRLLRLCWGSPECKIPADTVWIFRKMRAVTDHDKEVVQSVLDEFFKKKGGKLFNQRLLEEWVKARDGHEKRILAGAKGGLAKALKTKETASSNALEMLKQPEPEPELKRVDDDDGSQAREIDVLPQPKTDREIILEAIGVNPVSGLTGKGGRMIGTAADMQFAQRWADLGLSLGEQCAVIRETMANKRDGPPSGFSYFDKPMAKLAAAKSAPPITPIHQPNQTTGGIHGNGNRYGNASRIGGDRFLDEIATAARARPSSGGG